MAKANLLKMPVLVALIGQIGKSQSELTSNIQNAAVSAIGYSIVHGDIRPAQQLLDAMGKSLRKDSLLKYLEVNGNVRYDKADKKLVHEKQFDRDFFTAEMQADLMTLAWNEAKKPPELKSRYDMDELFSKWLAATRATVKKAQAGGVVVANVELLDLLASTEANFYAKKVLGMSTVDAATENRQDIEAVYDEAVRMNAERDVVTIPVPVAVAA